jgi:glycerol transport system ATP-binding protein
MASVALSGVRKSFGALEVLHGVNLDIAEGEFVVLVGPSGSGKTTLLRIIAGLERLSAGAVRVDGRGVEHLAPKDRDIAMVFQHYALYPHMTVRENLGFSLRMRNEPKTRVQARVDEVAAILGLTPLLERRPAELSGGQQQRTALARALAKDTNLVLLDEPLANLDYKLREELREQLRQLFERKGTTVVYATTEPQEALQLGGQTLVLSEGRLIQHGPTLELFRRPATLATARAFSDPPLNEIRAEIDPGAGVALLSEGISLPLSADAARALGSSKSSVVLGIRAHQFRLEPRNGHGALAGRVDLAEISGSETYVHVSSGSLSFVAQLTGVHDFALGDRCTLYVDPADLYFFEPDGRLLFAPN